MMRRTFKRGPIGLGLVSLVCAFLVAPAAWAQQVGGIAGQVTDTTAGALPGVTVEVDSPALIGGTQVVFTDGEGRYNAINLPIGPYSVTFTLPGFSTIIRDGIDIGAGFTANIDVELSVGAVEETITVTGAAPVVDVQTVRQQRTLPAEELQVLPSGNIGLQTLANVTPGFAVGSRGGVDVGGTVDTWVAQMYYTFYHGKPGTRASFNGFRQQYFIGSASGSGYVMNSDTIAEMQLEITGMDAESGSGSTSLNAIPKEGSNTLTATINTKYSNAAMHGDNLNEDLEALGLTTSSEAQKIYRASGTIGGPIIQDKLWFFGAIARVGMRVNLGGQFFNRLQGMGCAGRPGCTATDTNTLFYEPDPSKPAANHDWNRSHALRLTWQASERNRFGFFGDVVKSCRCTADFTGRNSIEARPGWDNWPNGVVHFSWTNPVTSRILLESGYGWNTYNWVNMIQPGVVDGADRGINDRGVGLQYGSPSGLRRPQARTGRAETYFKLSYVTGTHNMKFGITDETAFNDEDRDRVHADELNYGFRNGVPERIDYQALPFFQQERMNMELGLFAQDQWTIDRMTLNLGIRMDYVTMGFPADTLPAGQFVPARTVEELTGVPEWTDINPRLGISYDIFGNGRTAYKISMGRYNGLTRSDMTRGFHPFSSSVNTANRDWDDLNGDYVVDCDVSNMSANGECGPISNTAFGTFRAASTTFSDDIIKDNRRSTWDFLTELQHEVITGLSLSFGYNRNWSNGWKVADNTLVESSDFDEFCFTAPSDSRLPGGGGNEVCGNYDVDPAKFGQIQYEYSDSAKFGGISRVWNGMTAGVDGRFPNGITLAGGIDVGHSVLNHCITIDEPNGPRGGRGTGSTNNLTTVQYYGTGTSGGEDFCEITTGGTNLTDVRLRGSFPMPRGFAFSWIYKNAPGLPINATQRISRANVRFVDRAREALNQGGTGPGRLNRSGVVLDLHARDTVFTDRLTQVDLRFSKSLNFLGTRADMSVDLFNALNSSSYQGVIGVFGSRYLRPTTTLAARLLQFSTVLSF